ncbi:MAG TPA: heavy metal-binding domain-containing protein [Bryobacteraceae bacterium]|nr:heavy metal-binding domain-containing protein [Bryobacteraceae bacterium]
MHRLAVVCVVLFLAVFLAGQTKPPAIPGAPPPPKDYVCPMDPDVRSEFPGKCPRCGMTLVLGIPDPVEYPLHVALKPRLPKPGDSVELTFKISDPKTGAPVTHFELVHEKLFHMFIVSQDLEFFLHDHPVTSGGGLFRYSGILPKAGMYRVLADYYPSNGVPQLTATTIFVPGGGLKTAHLSADTSPKHTENLQVELTTEPPAPIAGFKTMLFFHLKPAEGLEQYIGAWGHMLAASDDLIDLIHTHPFLANGGPDIQFNVIFPRAHTYRLWVQFQRKGVVNTAIFTIPVSELK